MIKPTATVIQLLLILVFLPANSSALVWARGKSDGPQQEPSVSTKKLAKDEPVSSTLIATIPHPVKTANVMKVIFSPDGSRLFTAGYPSGIVQIWDVASCREIRRIETPPGYRGSANYAWPTPDWGKLYVPVEKRRPTRIDRDGRQVLQIEQFGQVKVWDMTTGQEQSSLTLTPSSSTSPFFAKLSEGGRVLLTLEQPGTLLSNPMPKQLLVAWNLPKQSWRALLCTAENGFTIAPDEKTVIVGTDGSNSEQPPAIQVLELRTGKVLASVPFKPKGSSFTVGSISPDGANVVIYVAGDNAETSEIWFLDALTLAPRGRMTGKNKPDRRGWNGSGSFNRDCSRFGVADASGKLMVWNVAKQEIEATLASGGESRSPIFSPDGSLLAAAWMPPVGPGVDLGEDPDPRDLPQPRVTVFDLSGKAPPRVLIAPHGYVGGLAFSPDSKTLAFGSCGAVHLFDLAR
jgi:WD40 repeat protein